MLALVEVGRVAGRSSRPGVVGKGGAPIPVTEDEIQAKIREQAKRLAGGGIEARVEMRQVVLGGPAHPIAEIAEGANADLIVA